jgi:hypothetical protein
MSERPISRRTLAAVSFALAVHSPDAVPLITTLQKDGAISDAEGARVTEVLEDIAKKFPYAAFNEMRIDLIVILWDRFTQPKQYVVRELHAEA